MTPETVCDRVRRFIGGIAWKVFLWAQNMDEETYFDIIYQQELIYRKMCQRISKEG